MFTIYYLLCSLKSNSSQKDAKLKSHSNEKFLWFQKIQLREN